MADTWVFVKIPSSLIEEIDEILSNKKLEGWLPQPRCYEAFVIQAIQNELYDLNGMIENRLMLPPTGKYFSPKSNVDW